jgi:hypothetical protein
LSRGYRDHLDRLIDSHGSLACPNDNAEPSAAPRRRV